VLTECYLPGVRQWLGWVGGFNWGYTMQMTYMLGTARSFAQCLYAAFYYDELPGVWREFVLTKLKLLLEQLASHLTNEKKSCIQNVVDLCERQETDRSKWREAARNTAFLGETEEVYSEGFLDDFLDGPEQNDHPEANAREAMLSSLVAAGLLHAAKSVALGWVFVGMREQQCREAAQRFNRTGEDITPSLESPTPNPAFDEMSKVQAALSEAVVQAFGAFLNDIVQAVSYHRCLENKLPVYEEGVSGLEYLLELQMEILLIAKKHQAQWRLKR
jgi:hypothetical protein